MPARLFAADPDGARERALAATLRSIDSVLAEPLEDCLARDATGAPCLEVRSPVDLEADVGLPGGHIFHRDLAWPWAEHDDEVGGWGVETADPRVLIAGAGARRGGGVSGIPGRAAAIAVLGTPDDLREYSRRGAMVAPGTDTSGGPCDEHAHRPPRRRLLVRPGLPVGVDDVPLDGRGRARSATWTSAGTS